MAEGRSGLWACYWSMVYPLPPTLVIAISVVRDGDTDEEGGGSEGEDEIKFIIIYRR
uniref:Uncharacterized protein n=1 Tax=Rhodnius prolixus TaxID=13249 RepID=T1HF96_RHOPR